MTSHKQHTTYPWIQSYDSGLDWFLDVPEKPVFSLLDDASKKYENQRALDFLGKSYTWKDLAGLVDKFAHGLQKTGIKKGDHVGLCLPNCPYYIIAYYGVLKIGASVVNFNPLYAERELAHQIEDSETDVMVTLDLALMYDKMETMLHSTRLEKIILCRFADALPFPQNMLFPFFKAGDIGRIKPDKRLTWFHDLIQNEGTPIPVPVDPVKDVAVIQYTGGTTGVPKGAMLTHANVYCNTLQSVSWFVDVESGNKKMLGVLPFFHVFAMTAIMNFSVMKGFEIITTPRFDLKETLKIIDKKKPHLFPAVPAIYSAINAYADLRKYDLSSLEFCISGGAPLPVEVKKEFEKNTGCIVVEGYGLSETSPVACINPVKGENIPGSIGLPVPGTIIEIISLDDHETVMPSGERGELCIRGPQVMKGYWNKPDDTEKTLKNGRLHTGDVAIMDERGYIYIVDRIKDMIITNGYNVYPRNVEEAIYLHPSVEECIVAGLPDEKRGEVVKAWIKLKDGRELSEEDLRTFLKDKISKMEIPKLVEFRTDPLPKTMIGKLSRKDVIEQG